MAATLRELQELHKLVAKSMTERVRQDLEDGVPTDAATLGAITKFLKDNNVSADPADKEDLNTLRDNFIELRKAREERRRKQQELGISLAQNALKVMEG